MCMMAFDNGGFGSVTILYEGFAVWLEALLCKETNNSKVWNAKKDGLREDYAQLLEFFEDAESRLSRFGLISQMRRAVVSIPSNIAEGYGRRSQKEFRQFLTISYGSVFELETQIIISKKLKFTQDKEFKQSFLLLEELSKMLTKMIHTINSKR